MSETGENSPTGTSRPDRVLRTEDAYYSKVEQQIDVVKSFYPLKKYFKIYTSGFDGAANLREKLMETNTFDEAKALL